MKQTERKYYIDFLNVAAIFAVIVLHSSQVVFQNKFDHVWVAASLLQSLFIWAVPVFIMISGANLIGYRERYDTRTFFIKRFKRVLIPLLFWSIVWFIYNGRHDLGNLQLSAFLHGLVFNQIQNIFWFFYVIIGLYLVTPILTFLVDRKYQNIGKYIIFANIAYVSVFQFLFSIILHKGMPSELYSIPIITDSYLAMFIFGYYVDNDLLSSLEQKVITIMGIVIGAVVTITIPVISVMNHSSIKYWNSYSGFPVVLLSMAIFILARLILRRVDISVRVKNVLVWLSKYSLGIYIIHEFVIDTFENHFNWSSQSYSHLLILPFVTYGISLIFIAILKKIPLINNLVP